MSQPRIVAFSDGASKGNPGPGGWGVVVVTPEGAVVELGGGAPATTNNRMELTGAIMALTEIQGHACAVDVYTDSTYVIKGIKEWVPNWRRRGWTTSTGSAVVNRDLWETLSALTSARGPRMTAWHYVRGHVGIPGNERVDAIADGYATGTPVALYRGPLSGYDHPVLDIPDETSLPASRPDRATPRRGSKGAAYCYLSLVDGALMRHASWADCEARVKGRSGARFKKAVSAGDAAAIAAAWGVRWTVE